MHGEEEVRSQLEQILSADALAALREAPLPERVELLHPVPMGREDPGTGWIFEPLYDGVRCLAIWDGTSVRLLDDGTRPLAARIPALERALAAAGPGAFALDGEILDVDPEFEQGIVLSGLERAADTGSRRKLEPRFIAFDLLHVAGCDLTGVPLVERRRVLRALFHFSPMLMYVRESVAPARIVFDQAEREGWLGVVAKRADAPYDPGSEAWRAWHRDGAEVSERRDA